MGIKPEPNFSYPTFWHFPSNQTQTQYIYDTKLNLHLLNMEVKQIIKTQFWPIVHARVIYKWQVYLYLIESLVLLCFS